MQMSDSEKSIVAYFSTTGQVVSAGDQLRSLLQIADPSSVVIKQVGQAGSTSQAANPEEGNNYMLTIAVSQAQSHQAMEIIRSQGGIIK